MPSEVSSGGGASPESDAIGVEPEVGPGSETGLMMDVSGPSGGCAPDDLRPTQPTWPRECKLTIQVPNYNTTLYFWDHAELWEDVKRWISRKTFIPTAQFHLIRAWTGERLRYNDPIPFDAVTITEGVPSWMTITVVLKAW